MTKYIKTPKHSTGRNITTKSAYGSHSNMMVPCEDQIFQNIQLKDNQVLCRDDDGMYLTEKQYIDSGLADPNRYGRPESRKLFTTVDNQN